MMKFLRTYAIKLRLPLVVFLSLLLSSCKKFVVIEPAPNLIATNAIFSSDNTALAAASGVYTQMRSTTTIFSNGGLSLYTGLSADEIYATAPNATTNPFFQNNLVSANATVRSSFYTPAYKIIYQANAVLEGLLNSSAITGTLQKQLMGEMKIVRALNYYYLVNLFGDVPLITSTDYRLNATKPRSTAVEVYQQIINDLKEAENLLLNTYPTAGKLRPNKWTAKALLARVYLSEKNWANAEAEATAVISSGSYTLVPAASISNVFLKNSTETIWELASPSEGTPTGEAALFIPSTTTVRPTYALTNSLYSAFEIADQRRQWLGKNTVGGQDYYYPRKYKQRSVTTGGSPTEYQIVLRLAEQYLIRAEARAQQNNIAGAQDDLNKIRNRAGLPNTTGNTQASILAAIAHENRLEYFSEWGHRWLDLKRTGMADAVLTIAKGTHWQTTDALYPIPDIEIIYNQLLSQNPGY